MPTATKHPGIRLYAAEAPRTATDIYVFSEKANVIVAAVSFPTIVAVLGLRNRRAWIADWSPASTLSSNRGRADGIIQAPRRTDLLAPTIQAQRTSYFPIYERL